MSKSPVHANRIQKVLYQEGERAIGEGFSRSKPDHLVRQEGARRIGAKLLLATGLTAAAVTGANKLIDAQPKVPKLEDVYTVQPGDNPWTIAEKFTPEGEDPRGLHDELTRQDAFRDDGVLNPGDILQVPTTSTTGVHSNEISQPEQPVAAMDTSIESGAQPAERQYDAHGEFGS